MPGQPVIATADPPLASCRVDRGDRRRVDDLVGRDPVDHQLADLHWCRLQPTGASVDVREVPPPDAGSRRSRRRRSAVGSIGGARHTPGRRSATRRLGDVEVVGEVARRGRPRCRSCRPGCRRAPVARRPRSVTRASRERRRCRITGLKYVGPSRLEVVLDLGAGERRRRAACCRRCTSPADVAHGDLAGRDRRGAPVERRGDRQHRQAARAACRASASSVGTACRRLSGLVVRPLRTSCRTAHSPDPVDPLRAAARRSRPRRPGRRTPCAARRG